MKIFDGIAELSAAAGQELGSSEWTVIEQPKVDTFADATGDHQWIHCDPARAAEGPFGGTIAHGLLTLALLPVLQHQIYRVDNVGMAINYGLNKVRFPAPVRVGARVRASSTLLEVTPLEGAAQAVLSTVIEIEGGGKPACVAESIVRYVA
ncbi:MaoC family dehydratase [Nocardia bovistercoris]|uniref:MaoC family dehydratase n=1 Tax=Nocardia bovistercoris TaxID=2785916 RepID=A0A931I9W0_9NOCA|nr:MaoC family dehydratase [Nocardia bovistercoris]MBH0776731.1 MaoC family dehydratase [Nocardia bovistercoris]